MSAILEDARLDILIKRCTCCGLTKVWREFPARSRWGDGHVKTVLSWCRTCTDEATRNWQAENRERYLARKRETARRHKASLSSRYDPLLPIGPLQEFIHADGRDHRTIAAIAGVGERSVRRVLSQEQQYVTLYLADQIITRMGGCLELVYPFEPEEGRS
ncbi:MAG TPA: hypothetical protein VHV75_09945 [Solirubrobacteraceae bacterium]|jgi:hypothetical protein|nr:hypothetical protein [Solirubrobacteraceae bacterium]